MMTPAGRGRRNRPDAADLPVLLSAHAGQRVSIAGGADRLRSISGVSFDEATADRLMVRVDDTILPVIGLAALFANKRASGRPKDRHDVEQLGGGADVGRAPRRRKKGT